MTDLSVQCDNKSGVIEVVLEGSLNETADFSSVSLDGGKEAFVDFNGVGFINSTGINKWVKWMQLIDSDFAGVQFQFCNCPKIIVDQINMIRGFLPKNGRVESFWLPYYCEESDRREFVLLTRGKEFMEQNAEGDDWVKMPECHCSETNTECEPDIMPKKYFSFLKAEA